MPKRAPLKSSLPKQAAPSLATDKKGAPAPRQSSSLPVPSYSMARLPVLPPGAPTQPVQRVGRPNKTGLPDRLKAGVETLSGLSMDDVRVHRNSPEPATLQAHAFARGTDIHLGSGQDRHLPHEAWHIVQQKQGRVRPTLQMKTGPSINDDPGLEREADRMGARASAIGTGLIAPEEPGRTGPTAIGGPIQMSSESAADDLAKALAQTPAASPSAWARRPPVIRETQLPQASVAAIAASAAAHAAATAGRVDATYTVSISKDFLGKHIASSRPGPSDKFNTVLHIDEDALLSLIKGMPLSKWISTGSDSLEATLPFSGWKLTGRDAPEQNMSVRLRARISGGATPLFELNHLHDS